MDQAVTSFLIKALSPHTGAEIRGIDLRQPVDEEARTALNQAFMDHAVLVIRDQKLSAQEFLEAMQVFGKIFPQHNTRFQVPDARPRPDLAARI
jgi:taurine dioxygenase